jgi:hypothetical protein
MGIIYDPVSITPAQVTGAVKLLRRVGLTDEATFEKLLQETESYTEGHAFGWVEPEKGMSFMVERDSYSGEVTGIYVLDLRQYSGAPALYSADLIVEVNSKLRRMFIKGYPNERELRGLEKVTILETYYNRDDSSALLRRASGEELIVPLWQLAGRTRLSDDYNDWKFQDGGEL